MSALLEVRGLVAEFQTPGGAIRAVDGLDLDIAPGEIVGLVGESGSGKTALGLSLLGLMPAGPEAHPAGSIRFEGRELCRADEAAWREVRGRRAAMVFQEPMTSLNPVMRIGDQVGESLRVHGLADRKAAGRAAIEALARVGIPAPAEVARRWPHELSGGMRQRAMIAAAMIAGPRLLIADEPTTALDVTIEAQILDLLRDLREREGAAILLITHDLGVVAEVADRVVVMYAGQVVEDAPAADLFSRPLHPYAEGLLASMPRPGVRGRRLPAIPGIVPRPHERPAGCRFAPRCPYRIDACASSVELRTFAGGRTARCLRAGEVGGGFAAEADR